MAARALATAFVNVVPKTASFAGDLEAGLAAGTSAAGRSGDEAALAYQNSFRGKLNKMLGISGPMTQQGKQDAEAYSNSFKGTAMSVLSTVGKAGALVLAAGMAFAIDQGVKLQESQDKLAVAVEHAGGSMKVLGPAINQAGQGMEKFGFTQTQTDQALAVLTTATGSAKESLGLLGTAADLAKFKNESLGDAANTLAKAAGGAARGIKDLGITQVTGATQAAAMGNASTLLQDRIQQAGGMAGFAASQHMSLARAEELVKAATGGASAALSDLAGHGLTLTSATTKVKEALGGDATAAKELAKAGLSVSEAQTLIKSAAEGSLPALNALGIVALPKSATAAERLAQITDVMNAKIGGEASKAAQTTEGKLEGMKAQLGDLAAKIGQAVLPYIEKFIDLLTRSHLLIPLVVTALGLLTAATIAWGVAMIAANLPIVAIIAGIALLVAAGIYLAKNWDTVWRNVKAIVMDVWDWIKDHWPLLLGILTGPVGLAVLYIVQHWNAIVNGLRTAYDDVIGFFKRLPGDIVNALGNLGSLLINAGKSIVGGLISGLKSSLGPLGSVLGGIGGFIAAHKGPLDVDAMLLYPHGQAIMGGLQRGIQSGLPSLQSQLGGISGMIGGGVSGGSGGQVVIQLGGAGSGPLENMFWEWLKGKVLAKGGGGANSVQIALGQTHL